MIQNLSIESTIVWDNKCPDGEIPEQPIVIEDYKGSDNISISGPNGDVTIPYRMIDEVCKVMKGYKPKD